jgi:hypothetical protein
VSTTLHGRAPTSSREDSDDEEGWNMPKTDDAEKRVFRLMFGGSARARPKKRLQIEGPRDLSPEPAEPIPPHPETLVFSSKPTTASAVPFVSGNI